MQIEDTKVKMNPQKKKKKRNETKAHRGEEDPAHSTQRYLQLTTESQRIH